MKEWIMRCLWVSIAIIMVSAPVQAASWSVSGDLRERYQSFDNFDFNSAANADSREFDSRLYLKVRGDLGSGFTAFLQPQAVIIKNHTVANGTQNFTQSDLLQAYLHYDVGDFSLRLGRQQLAYGDQRLLGHLGWKDIARTFDGIKGMYHGGPVSLDVFAVHPADIGLMTPTPVATASTPGPQGKSLVTWEDRRLIGTYGTYAFAAKSGIDAYLINWRHNQRESTGPGRNIYTYGTRLFGQWNGLDATAEAVFQSGTWTNGISQKASAYAAKAGYTFDFWETRFGVEYDFSPGDDKSNATVHKNFVFPFHTNHMYYGEMDRFSWANMKDMRLSVKTSPATGLSLVGDVHFFHWIRHRETG